MNQPPWPDWAIEIVEIVEHDPGWAQAGELEGARLQRLLDTWRVGDVEHVGSTAIPGLTAKPILDFQVQVTDLDVAVDVAAVLAGHDWHYVPPALDRRPYRRFFVKVSDGRRAAHLHLLLATGNHWRRQLAFRDALRADPERRREYARLKDELAERHRDDREAYSAGKLAFIDAVLR